MRLGLRQPAHVQQSFVCSYGTHPGGEPPLTWVKGSSERLPCVTASSKTVAHAGTEKDNRCLMYRGTYAEVLLL